MDTPRYILRPDTPDLQRAKRSTSMDEVICYDVACIHFERMGNNEYWVGIDFKNGEQMMLGMYADRATVRFVVTEQPETPAEHEPASGPAQEDTQP